MLALVLSACQPDTVDPDQRARGGEEPLAGPECDPVVHVPAPLGGIDGSASADPHQDVFGAAPDPQFVHIGWPSSDPSTSASFVWRTDPDTLATVLEFGANGQLDQRVEGSSFSYGGLPGQPGPQRVHEVKLCAGLTPGTTYSYRVGGKGHWSPTYTFTTAGDPATFDTFRVALVGDSRGAYETWAEVMAAVDAEDPDVILFSGDMIEFGTNQEEWDAWFRATGDLLARKPLIAAHGNHEFLAVHYFAQWSFPNNEQWFSIRYGDLELVVLNDTVVGADDVEVVQPGFMEPILAGSDARWKVAMHHQATWSTSSNHGSALDVRAAWQPVWDRTGVDLVLAGHNHLYERSVPIVDDQPAPAGEGIVYLVSGGAGAELYEGIDPSWFGAVANPIVHYVIGDFGPNGADFVVRDLAGNVIDEFAL